MGGRYDSNNEGEHEQEEGSGTDEGEQERRRRRSSRGPGRGDGDSRTWGEVLKDVPNRGGLTDSPDQDFRCVI